MPVGSRSSLRNGERRLNRKYLRFAAPVVGVLLALLLWSSVPAPARQALGPSSPLPSLEPRSQRAARPRPPELKGVVRSSGGTVAGAKVVAHHLTLPVTVGTVTDNAGRYRLGSMLAGAYRIEVVHPAHQALIRDSVTTNTPQPALDFALQPRSGPSARSTSAEWLSLLPAGDMKRRFILDCTGCHRFDDSRALLDGATRPEARWKEDIKRMLGFAGAHSSFPVISSFQDTASTAGWLAHNLTTALTSSSSPVAGSTMPNAGEAARAVITEYDTPEPGDLPHDVAIESTGTIVVTGMFSHAMYVLDPSTGHFVTHEIPVPNANPRAVEIDSRGNWWVLLGGPRKLARFDRLTSRWTTFDIEMYPHSIGLAPAPGGAVWFNGHFTHAPELVGNVDPATGKVTTYPVTPHPTLANDAGGPIPYELRIAPSGTVWISELQGNRILSFDPATQRSEAFELPTPLSGPRRFDIDQSGVLWIPTYSGNTLVRFDPATRRFAEHPIPVPDATPYVARVDHGSGLVWLGMAASDQIASFDPKTSRFTFYPVPTNGALIRHMAIDPKTHDVWVAYGAAPGRIPSKIARLHLNSD